MSITKWNPFRTSTWDPFEELQEFENRLAAAFGRTPPKSNGGSKEEALTVSDWAPAVDITEDEKEYLVKAELPGLKKEEVMVTVEDGVVSISGERKFEKEEKTKKYHRVERAYGKFERSFTLPDLADSTKVKADYKEGVLTVHLPKSEKVVSSAVQVKIE